MSFELTFVSIVSYDVSVICCLLSCVCVLIVMLCSSFFVASSSSCAEADLWDVGAFSSFVWTCKWHVAYVREYKIKRKNFIRLTWIKVYDGMMRLTYFGSEILPTVLHATTLFVAYELSFFDIFLWYLRNYRRLCSYALWIVFPCALLK